MHLTTRHVPVPCMINDEIRAFVRADGDHVMPWPNQSARQRSHYPRPGLVPLIPPGTRDLIGYSIVHAVGFILPATAAVETVIPPAMQPDAWTFERVPVVHPTIHFPM